jgi:hypothetical protein
MLQPHQRGFAPNVETELRKPPALPCRHSGYGLANAPVPQEPDSNRSNAGISTKRLSTKHPSTKHPSTRTKHFSTKHFSTPHVRRL